MPHYRAIRRFLSHRHGYYCEECLAARLNLSLGAIRRCVGQRTLADVPSPTESVETASVRRRSSPCESALDFGRVPGVQLASLGPLAILVVGATRLALGQGQAHQSGWPCPGERNRYIFDNCPD